MSSSLCPVSAPVEAPPSPTVAEAVAAQPSPAGGLLTPALAQIIAAFQKDGNGDNDLLKLLLTAKAKEDERLAALDQLRAEQLRAAHALAWQSYQQQQWIIYQQQAAAAAASESPTSPCSAASTGSSFPWTAQPTSAKRSASASGLPSPADSTIGKFTKRPRAQSDVSSTSSDSTYSHSSANQRSSAPKKPRSSTKAIAPAPAPAAHTATAVPSHDQVMQALRRRCGEKPADEPSSATASTSSAALVKSASSSSSTSQALSPKATKASARTVTAPKRSVAIAAASMRALSPAELKPSTTDSSLPTPVSPVVGTARPHNSFQMLLNASVVAEAASEGNIVA